MRISDWSSDVCSSDLFAGENIERLIPADTDPFIPATQRLVAPTGLPMLPDHRIFEPVSAQEPEAQRLPASACPKLRTIPAVLDSVVGPHPDHDPVFDIGLVEALTAAIGPAIGRDPLTLTIGRASRRDRVCQYVEISVVAV